jgi:hypothetical protein
MHSTSAKNLAVAVIGVLASVGLWVSTVSAQQLTGEIKGTVTDITGGAVPEAQVTANNTQTGVSQTIPSKSDGSFEFLQLPVGMYSVTAEKTGFTKFTAENIQLVLNQTFTLAVKLQVGSVNQTVEVQANAVQVETSTTQLGTVIQSQTIVDLPLNGRNWVTLEQLAPGVVAGSDRFGTNYATNGSQSQQNSFLVNGADDVDLPLNDPSFIPSADAIAEFNLIDSTINPEYGRNSGGVLNAIIKSGTNQFHGDAFDFYRDTFLDSRNLFSIDKPVFHQNQFGGTVGGPIWKDHTFFFLSYQGTRNRQPETTASDTTTVFTPAQRAGDFGPGFVTSTNTSPIPLVGSDGATYPAGTPYSTIFAGGTIPAADINPISAKLLSTYVPNANLGTNIFSFNPIQTNTIDQGIARLDHTFGASDSMWVNLSFQHNQAPETIPFTGATLPGFGDESTEAFKFFTADWTHTFTPTTVNEVRVSYLRFNFVTVEPQNPTLPSSAGFAINPEDPAGAGLPFISLTGFFNLGFSTNGPQPRIDSTYELADNFSKVVGKHTLKFGFEGKRYDVDNPFNGNNNGSFSFNGTGLYSTGNPAADFLLGIPDSYSQGSGGWIDARTYEYYAYAQDNWKVNENLTINFGAGYQIDTPLVNKHFGREDVNCFIPGQQSTVFPTAPVGVDYPGDPGCTASGYHEHYDHVGPRFGFAYSPGGGSNPSWVIRGGFGVYFNRSEEELSLQNLGVPPFSISSIGAVNPTFANPFVNIATGATTPNPFPFVAPAKGSNVNFAPYEPLELNVISPNFTDPYSMNYNLNIQKQLTGSMLLQVGYVGSLGRHEEMTYEGNPISPSFSAACATNPACVANASFQQASPTGALSTIYSSVVPANVLASVGYQATDGNSEYNSMQVSLKKQLSHGLSFQASYTWAHSIDDTSSFENSGFGARAIDPFNFGVDRADSVYDARQRLVISYDYKLPHISRYWSNGFTRTVLDGWHVSGISTWQTGFPINPSETDFNSLECSIYQFYGCWDAPNVVSSPQILNPRNSSLVNTVTPGAPTTPQNYYYFNPNTFSEETIGQLGDAGRNALHGPGVVNTDLSLSKRIYFSKNEKRFVELRAEAYNVFNHTEFTVINYQGSGVDGTINDQNFGRILTAYGSTSGTSGQTGGRTVQLAAKIYF